MRGDELLAALLGNLEQLPPHPIAPENRGVARLRPSPWVPRGQVYRVLVEEEKPWILMHPEDIAEILALYESDPPILFAWSRAQIEQDIADCCEQIFAEIEARGE